MFQTYILDQKDKEKKKHLHIFEILKKRNDEENEQYKKYILKL